MITGTVVKDMTADSVAADRKALVGLELLPVGVKLIVQVGDREMVPYDTITWLSLQGERLDIEVQGEHGAVARWVRALRDGMPGLMGWSA